MNISTISNSTSPSIYDISVTILNAQLVSNICWLVASTLGLIIGLLQIATTAFWKPLRKMDQSLIVVLAVADCMKLAGFGALATRRIYELAIGGNDVGSQIMCMVWLSFMMFPSNTELILIVMLSLDRLFSISFPMWYKNRTIKLGVVQILCSVLIGCSIGAAMFIGVSQFKLVPVCAYGTSPTESYLNFVKCFENSCVFSTLGINAVNVIILLHKWRKARRTQQNLSVFRKNLQVNALKILAAVVLVYLITSTAGSVTLTILNSSGWSDATRMSFTPIAGLFGLFRGLLDFPLYVLLVKEYRNGFREVVLKKMCCYFVLRTGSSGISPNSDVQLRGGQLSANGRNVGTRANRVGC